MIDSYHTVRGEASIELKRKASRFKGEVYPAKTVEMARVQLEAVRKREHAATHHCYAWRVGMPGEEQFKYSDDGEPSGSAGRPIYDALCGRDLTNTLVVVTRYYGGTKLGTGGLVRAYGDAASEALEKAGKIECFITGRFKVTVEFSLYDQLIKLLSASGVKPVESDFTDKVTLIVEVRLSREEALKDEIVGLSSGKAAIEKLA